MAAKKLVGHAAQEARIAERERRAQRVVLMAQRWARHIETVRPVALSAASHHLLRAVQRFEES